MAMDSERIFRECIFDAAGAGRLDYNISPTEQVRFGMAPSVQAWEHFAKLVEAARLLSRAWRDAVAEILSWMAWGVRHQLLTYVKEMFFEDDCEPGSRQHRRWLCHLAAHELSSIFPDRQALLDSAEGGDAPHTLPQDVLCTVLYRMGRGWARLYYV